MTATVQELWYLLQSATQCKMAINFDTRSNRPPMTSEVTFNFNSHQVDQIINVITASQALDSVCFHTWPHISQLEMYILLMIDFHFTRLHACLWVYTCLSGTGSIRWLNQIVACLEFMHVGNVCIRIDIPYFPVKLLRGIHYTWDWEDKVSEVY